VVEIFVNNFGSPSKATEYLKTANPGRPAQVDPDKLVRAFEKGASAWGLHERAMKGEFEPAKAFDPRTHF
jgi:hypothetical protein